MDEPLVSAPKVWFTPELREEIWDELKHIRRLAIPIIVSNALLMLLQVSRSRTFLSLPTDVSPPSHLCVAIAAPVRSWIPAPET